MAKEVGAERVKVFPEAEYQKLRSGALEAARKLEGSKDWWSKGTVEKIEAIR
jgi:hypothetical protein